MRSISKFVSTTIILAIVLFIASCSKQAQTSSSRYAGTYYGHSTLRDTFGTQVQHLDTIVVTSVPFNSTTNTLTLHSSYYNTSFTAQETQNSNSATVLSQYNVINNVTTTILGEVSLNNGNTLDIQTQDNAIYSFPQNRYLIFGGSK